MVDKEPESLNIICHYNLGLIIVHSSSTKRKGTGFFLSSSSNALSMGNLSLLHSELYFNTKNIAVNLISRHLTSLKYWIRWDGMDTWTDGQMGEVE